MDLYNDKDKSTVYLPICMPPPVKAYLPFAIVSTIITANMKSYDWLLNNFIQIFKKKNTNRIDTYPNQDFMYTDNILLSATELNGFNYKINKETFINDIIDWINKKNYVVLYLDESKLEGTREFGGVPLLHSQFIFGYNTEKRVFKVMNFEPKLQDLAVLDISFDNMVEAFFCESTTELYNKKNTHGVLRGKKFKIILLRITEKIDETYNFEINIKGINRKLYEYLYGENSSLSHQYFTGEQRGDWGLEVYKAFILVLEEERPEVHYTYIHLIYEHKVFMKNRFERLEELGECVGVAQMYEAIVKYADKLRLLCLKFLFVQKQETKNEMKQLLAILYEQEKKALKFYFSQIEVKDAMYK